MCVFGYGAHENGPFDGESKLPLLLCKSVECVGINEFVSGAGDIKSFRPISYSFGANFCFGNVEKFFFKWAGSNGLHNDNSSGCRMPKSLHRFTTALNVFVE